MNTQELFERLDVLFETFKVEHAAKSKAAHGRARKALGEMQEGDVLEVRADDPETLQDMPALCNRIGVQLLDITEDAGEYRFLIKK